MIKNEKIHISPELEQLISNLTPEKLKALRHIATIESVGSSTRLAGAKLSDKDVENLLERLEFTMERERITRASLPRLASDILQLVQDKGKITIADVIQATNAPRSTIKKYLNMLVDQKYLTRHGQGRSVWYTQAM